MRIIRFLLLLFLIGCSSSKVITDYDAKIDFTTFTSYNFYDDFGKGLNELDVKRITKAIDYHLKEKGFSKSEQPDFLINVIVNFTEAQNNNTIGIGIGSGGNNGGFGISGGIPIGGKKLNEELIIEFVNAKTNDIIWEGVLNSKVKEKRKPEEKVLHFNEVISKILLKYPPN